VANWRGDRRADLKRAVWIVSAVADHLQIKLRVSETPVGKLTVPETKLPLASAKLTAVTVLLTIVIVCLTTAAFGVVPLSK